MFEHGLTPGTNRLATECSTPGRRFAETATCSWSTWPTRQPRGPRSPKASSPSPCSGSRQSSLGRMPQRTMKECDPAGNAAMTWEVLGRLAFRAANRALVRRQMLKAGNSPDPVLLTALLKEVGWNPDEPQPQKAVTAEQQAEWARRRKEAVASMYESAAEATCYVCGRPNEIIGHDRFGAGHHLWLLKIKFADGEKLHTCPGGAHLTPGHGG